jgi:hypothetical protein
LVGQVSLVDTLLEAQKSDIDLQKMYTWITQGRCPASKEDSAESYFLKSLVSQFDRLCIQDNLICRKWEDLSTDQTIFQYVVPYSERRNVLLQYHDERTAGHLGIKKS